MASLAKQIVSAAETKVGIQATAPAPSSDLENATFVFILSWALWLVLLTGLSKTRVGYVLLYYSLVIMILFVVLTQVATLAPLLSNISSIGAFNILHPPSTTSASTANNTTAVGVPIPGVSATSGEFSTPTPIVGSTNSGNGTITSSNPIFGAGTSGNF